MQTQAAPASVTFSLTYSKGVWVATYYDATGAECFWSDVVDHPEMPRDPTAKQAAERIASRVARHLYA
jgi:hypothetical protein